ncbi:hypothetical protein DFH08DRAFT_1077424 [Mycena albidolilacea]|uniref:DUF6534 domain-containing protein n=1 Tax=Mycena albidolilacea TaxID=1033008 RepID=A0AAD7EXG9_9AGAR|nr:hypothetical protein DFH08DRAFT_1077424 [Mycena albidolilacea]
MRIKLGYALREGFLFTMSTFPPQPDVGKMLSATSTIPLFVGTVLNWCLLGALAVQVYIYILAFPKDRPVNKLLVALLFTAELLQTLGDSRNAIDYFGISYGNLDALDQVRWGWFSVPILGSTIACCGQMFFAWRIWIIGRAWYTPALIAVITTTQWIAGILTGVDIVRAGRYSRLQANRLRPEPIVWLSATAAADLIIVAGTLYYIQKSRDKNFRLYESNYTSLALSRIIKVCVETGVLCALFALTDLALFLGFDTNTHLSLCIWLSKVYSNSIMVILNSRAYIGHVVPSDASRPSMSDIVFHGQSWAARSVPVTVQLSVHNADDSTHLEDSDHRHRLELDKQRRQIGVHHGAVHHLNIFTPDELVCFRGGFAASAASVWEGWIVVQTVSISAARMAAGTKAGWWCFAEVQSVS